MNPLSIAGAGLGFIGMIGQGIARAKSNKELKKLMGQDVTRTRNTDVDTQYAMAQQMLNARDPYEQQAQNAAVTRFGNTTANIAKGATNSAQFLAANAAATGQFANDQQEANAGGVDTYYKNLEFMQQATAARQQENDAQYQDQIRKFENKVKMTGAIQQNRANTWGDVQNFGTSLASFGLSSSKKGKA